MSKHTPEPWVSDDRQDIDTDFYSDDATGSIIGGCQEYTFAHRDIEERRANARRIVTCVNACAGMEDPAAEIAELKRQRDELLKALQDAATSLETIQLRPFGADSYLDDKHSMRAYAGARAAVARSVDATFMLEPAK